ncbi:hypothetical protein IMX26_11770 [Clostridium sp. 'deep sea']|uniref:two-component system activity regulator YycH n=1 Tax=Clostridium sp. 'deep sea' TaxID=2779445 RepID=UPI0018968CC9|nr:two-component system activity regulator YycH [Clostridium sp. 'deep sea']QOR34165.1 hypothetical protein IMX26_11770 [Clostridium sp. 'deep sea']
MILERIKTLILIILVLTSLVLSLTLWTDVKNYEALPSWVLKSATVHQVVDPEDQPIVKNIEEEKLLSALLEPDRMVDHGKFVSRMYYLGSSGFASKAWSRVYESLKTGTNANITKINLDEWTNTVKSSSYEFLLAGSYPVNMMFPSWNGENVSMKIDRIMVTTGDKPEIYLRSLNYRTLYKVVLEDVAWPENGIKTFRGNGDNGWRVYDGGYGNASILTGVYLPSNFITNYGADFPEIMMSAETQDRKKWLSIFFTNTNLAREIVLSQNRYRYLFSSTTLAIDYNKAPHIEYSFVTLNKNKNSISYADEFLKSSKFANEHNYTNWPNFESDVKLVRTWKKTDKINFVYNTYSTGLKYNIPVLYSIPSYTVETEGGIVTEMTRQVWELGRHNKVPKIAIEPSDAIEKLSSDKWKVSTEFNPYAAEVVSKFQDYLKNGYKISDVMLSYFVDYKFTDSYLVAPHWAVTLTNGDGVAVRFLINALTSNVPQENGFIVE